MKTRNLRRRHNDPAPVTDGKRARKASPTLNLTLSSSEIAEDLKAISASLPPGGPVSDAGSSSTSGTSQKRDRTSPDGPNGDNNGGSNGNGGDGAGAEQYGGSVEAAIEDGKLIYQKKWYVFPY